MEFLYQLVDEMVFHNVHLLIAVLAVLFQRSYQVVPTSLASRPDLFTSRAFHVSPYAVAIIRDGDFHKRCVGTLISDSFVLTAAQCVDCESAELILGAYDILENEKTQIRLFVNSENVIFHPFYDPRNFDNDIALIRLPRRIPLNQFITTAALPNFGYLPEYGTKAHVTGWERRLTGYSNVFSLADVQIFSRDKCISFWPAARINYSKLCASETKREGKLTTILGADCIVDPGSPLTLEGDVDVIIGVLTRSGGCGTHLPEVFMSVEYYLDWIYAVLARYSNEVLAAVEVTPGPVVELLLTAQPEILEVTKVGKVIETPYLEPSITEAVPIIEEFIVKEETIEYLPAVEVNDWIYDTSVEDTISRVLEGKETIPIEEHLIIKQEEVPFLENVLIKAITGPIPLAAHEKIEHDYLVEGTFPLQEEVTEAVPIIKDIVVQEINGHHPIVEIDSGNSVEVEITETLPVIIEENSPVEDLVTIEHEYPARKAGSLDVEVAEPVPIIEDVIIADLPVVEEKKIEFEQSVEKTVSLDVEVTETYPITDEVIEEQVNPSVAVEELDHDVSVIEEMSLDVEATQIVPIIEDDVVQEIVIESQLAKVEEIGHTISVEETVSSDVKVTEPVPILEEVIIADLPVVEEKRVEFEHSVEKTVSLDVEVTETLPIIDEAIDKQVNPVVKVEELDRDVSVKEEIPLEVEATQNIPVVEDDAVQAVVPVRIIEEIKIEELPVIEENKIEFEHSVEKTVSWDVEVTETLPIIDEVIEYQVKPIVKVEELDRDVAVKEEISLEVEATQIVPIIEDDVVQEIVIENQPVAKVGDIEHTISVEETVSSDVKVAEPVPILEEVIVADLPVAEEKKVEFEHSVEKTVSLDVEVTEILPTIDEAIDKQVNPVVKVEQLDRDVSVKEETPLEVEAIQIISVVEDDAVEEVVPVRIIEEIKIEELPVIEENEIEFEHSVEKTVSWEVEVTETLPIIDEVIEYQVNPIVKVEELDHDVAVKDEISLEVEATQIVPIMEDDVVQEIVIESQPVAKVEEIGHTVSVEETVSLDVKVAEPVPILEEGIIADLPVVEEKKVEFEHLVEKTVSLDVEVTEILPIIDEAIDKQVNPVVKVEELDRDVSVKEEIPLEVEATQIVPVVEVDAVQEVVPVRIIEEIKIENLPVVEENKSEFKNSVGKTVSWDVEVTKTLPVVDEVIEDQVKAVVKVEELDHDVAVKEEILLEVEASQIIPIVEDVVVQEVIIESKPIVTAEEYEDASLVDETVSLDVEVPEPIRIEEERKIEDLPVVEEEKIELEHSLEKTVSWDVEVTETLPIIDEVIEEQVNRVVKVEGLDNNVSVKEEISLEVEATQIVPIMEDDVQEIVIESHPVAKVEEIGHTISVEETVSLDVKVVEPVPILEEVIIADLPVVEEKKVEFEHLVEKTVSLDVEVTDILPIINEAIDKQVNPVVKVEELDRDVSVKEEIPLEVEATQTVPIVEVDAVQEVVPVRIIEEIKIENLPVVEENKIEFEHSVEKTVSWDVEVTKTLPIVDEVIEDQVKAVVKVEQLDHDVAIQEEISLEVEASQIIPIVEDVVVQEVMIESKPIITAEEYEDASLVDETVSLDVEVPEPILIKEDRKIEDLPEETKLEIEHSIEKTVSWDVEVTETVPIMEESLEEIEGLPRVDESEFEYLEEENIPFIEHPILGAIDIIQPLDILEEQVILSQPITVPVVPPPLPTRIPSQVVPPIIRAVKTPIFVPDPIGALSFRPNFKPYFISEPPGKFEAFKVPVQPLGVLPEVNTKVGPAYNANFRPYFLPAFSKNEKVIESQYPLNVPQFIASANARPSINFNDLRRYNFGYRPNIAPRRVYKLKKVKLDIEEEEEVTVNIEEIEWQPAEIEWQPVESNELDFQDLIQVPVALVTEDEKDHNVVIVPISTIDKELESFEWPNKWEEIKVFPNEEWDEGRFPNITISTNTEVAVITIFMNATDLHLDPRWNDDHKLTLAEVSIPLLHIPIEDEAFIGAHLKKIEITGDDDFPIISEWIKHDSTYL